MSVVRIHPLPHRPLTGVMSQMTVESIGPRCAVEVPNWGVWGEREAVAQMVERVGREIPRKVMGSSPICFTNLRGCHASRVTLVGY